MRTAPSGNKCSIPRQYEFVLEHFCKAPVDAVRLTAAGAIDAWAWCDLAVKKKLVLTIADVLRLGVGESVKLLLLHRNWADVTLEEPTNKRGKAYDPKRFFRKERDERGFYPVGLLHRGRGSPATRRSDGEATPSRGRASPRSGAS
jgi:hypothetical protein